MKLLASLPKAMESALPKMTLQLEIYHSAKEHTLESEARKASQAIILSAGRQSTSGVICFKESFLKVFKRIKEELLKAVE